MEGAGFFDSISSKFSTGVQSVSGALATGVLRVILSANSTVLSLYKSSAKNMAARNPDRVPQAEEFLVKFSAAIREGLEEGKKIADERMAAVNQKYPVSRGGKRTLRRRRIKR